MRKNYITICCSLFFAVAASAQTPPPLWGHGGTNNYIGVGIIVTNGTLNSALSIYKGRGDVPWNFKDCIAYKWNASGQYWETSGYDYEFSTWDPNWTLVPGDALAVYYNRWTGTGDCTLPNHTAWNVDHQDCRYIYQTGTFHTGTVNITLRPGWNFICQPTSLGGGNDALIGQIGLEFRTGDKVGFPDGSNDFTPCAPSSMGYVEIFDAANGGWWQEWDNTFNWGTNGAAVITSSALWFYSSASTNRTWSATFTGPEN